MKAARARGPGLAFAAGFLAAAALRVGYLVLLAGNWDTRVYREFVEIPERGGQLYRDTAYYYSPVWALLLRGVSEVASSAGVSFDKAVGLLLLLADAAATWLVWRIARDRLHLSAARSAGAALLFFANPVSVFVTGFHVQFDNLAVLFLLGALHLAGRKPPRQAAAAGALAASLLVKQVTFFHPLLFARRGEKSLSPLAVVPYAVFFASLLPYWIAGQPVERVFGYGSLAEDYGIAMLLKLPGVPDWGPRALFFFAALGGVLALQRVEAARACLLLFLILIVFLPGIAQYYLVWPIALGSLFRGAGYAVYTLVVSAFFLGSPDGLGLEFEHFPGWHGIWWSAVFWLLWELRGLSKGRPR